jgi:predicted Zn-dependent protease
MKVLRDILGGALLVVAVADCGAGASARPAVTARSETPGALFEMAKQSAQNDDFVRAEQYASAAVAGGFSSDRATPFLVQVCIGSSRYRAALDYAAPYLDKHPDDLALRDLVATLELALGRASDARADLEEATRADPGRPASHYLLAVVLRDQFDDLAGASSEFSAYLRAAPAGEHSGEARVWLRAHAENERATRLSERTMSPHGGQHDFARSASKGPGFVSRAAPAVAR